MTIETLEQGDAGFQCGGCGITVFGKPPQSSIEKRCTSCMEKQRYEWAAAARLVTGAAPRAGYRSIMVDGLKFGSAEPIHHGSRGQSYLLKDAGDRQVNELTAGGRTKRPVEVMGDKLLHRRSPGTQHAPVFDRVLETARRLIREGKMRHPHAIGADVAARREAVAVWQIEEARKERIARAAPRMLDALKEIRDKLSSLEFGHATSECITLANGAIKTAEGEPGDGS